MCVQTLVPLHSCLYTHEQLFTHEIINTSHLLPFPSTNAHFHAMGTSSTFSQACDPCRTGSQACTPLLTGMCPMSHRHAPHVSQACAPLLTGVCPTSHRHAPHFHALALPDSQARALDRQQNVTKSTAEHCPESEAVLC